MPQDDIPIRVLVVDDYAVVRQCLPPFLSRLVDDITVVGVTGSGAEAVQAIGKLWPNVVLLGLTLPDISGLAVAQTVHETQPEVKIIAFTAHEDTATVEHLRDLGVSGYISKRQSMEQVIATMRAVAAGQTVWPPDAATSAPRDIALTGRQKEVLTLLGRGWHNTQIATALNIEETTVEYHVHRLFLKLDVHSRVEVVLKAEEQGLL